MVRIILREEYRREHELRPMHPTVKKSVNILDKVLTAVEIMSTSKTVRVARLLKEVLDIFSRR